MVIEEQKDTLESTESSLEKQEENIQDVTSDESGLEEFTEKNNINELEEDSDDSDDELITIQHEGVEYDIQDDILYDTYLDPIGKITRGKNGEITDMDKKCQKYHNSMKKKSETIESPKPKDKPSPSIGDRRGTGAQNALEAFTEGAGSKLDALRSFVDNYRGKKD